MATINTEIGFSYLLYATVRGLTTKGCSFVSCLRRRAIAAAMEAGLSLGDLLFFKFLEEESQ